MKEETHQPRFAKHSSRSVTHRVIPVEVRPESDDELGLLPAAAAHTGELLRSGRLQVLHHQLPVRGQPLRVDMTAAAPWVIVFIIITVTEGEETCQLSLSLRAEHNCHCH